MAGNGVGSQRRRAVTLPQSACVASHRRLHNIAVDSLCGKHCAVLFVVVESHPWMFCFGICKILMPNPALCSRFYRCFRSHAKLAAAVFRTNW